MKTWILMLALIAAFASPAWAEYVPMPLYGGPTVVETAQDSQRAVYAEPQFKRTMPRRSTALHRPYFAYSGPFFRGATVSNPLGLRYNYSAPKRYGYSTHYRNSYNYQ